ncbi:MAG: tRNA (adenosine(37)-N6)-threonylcarbamoyltransferase complex dimerization subunit type 1 TsaB [Verrucomicrobiae bacterium]|nr:tRNA (adenosine(37)-N6)-threonylcarbamoyltransferase complex dimerization subunit type 1 TsaB [Verrucomicrobiae bacterium]
MKILTLEFSSDHRSVAIGFNSQILGYEEDNSLPGASAFALIDSVLHQAGCNREEVECVSVGIGPGSYTGIRIAISIAQGWQIARGVKLLGISSVECAAAKLALSGAAGKYRILVDAQRGEFYSADFDISNGKHIQKSELKIVSAEEAKNTGDEKIIIAGADLDKDMFPSQFQSVPDAKTLYFLSCERLDFVDGERLEPIYLRPISFVKAPPPRIINV